jgi:hypothetical protein
MAFSLNVDDVKSSLKRWRESTATYGNRHLGHYKAMIAPTGEMRQDDEEIPVGDQILRIIVRMMNLAVKSGKPLPRWQKR